MKEIALAMAGADWRDYLELCKPRVVLLMLLTAAVGMLIATPGLPPLSTFVFTLSGIALVAGSAAVVNHVADAGIDRRMARTRGRPMAGERVPVVQALLFSLALGGVGLTLLTTLVNPLTALLNLCSWLGYALLYTLWLKRRTPQNIVIGGLFGALPPLFGWTAVTGSISVEPLLLVLLIFVWTPPHFWSLALDRIEDYAEADVPMLPITHGVAYTRWSILAYTLLLTAVSVLPWATGASGPIFLAGVLVLDALFLCLAVALVLGRADAPLRTFRYSITYLGLVFVILLADHFAPGVGR